MVIGAGPVGDPVPRYISARLTVPLVTTVALKSPPGATVLGARLAETSVGGWEIEPSVVRVRVGRGVGAAVGTGSGVGVAAAGGVGVGVEYTG
jgi:hypothetical protein